MREPTAIHITRMTASRAKVMIFRWVVTSAVTRELFMTGLRSDQGTSMPVRGSFGKFR